MALMPSQVAEFAKYLDLALLENREVERITKDAPDLGLPDAYRIQDEGIRLRERRGDIQIGLKMGLTSQAKRDQMGLTDAIYGVLTKTMQIHDGDTIQLKGKIHPKIEPEVAFLIGKEIRGTVSFDEALDACSGVCAAAEILDSRFLNFKYFSLPDVVADNASSREFVLSKKVLDPKKVDFGDVEIRMEVNGKLAQSASSKEISGHPLNSLVQLCKLLDDRGLYVPKGSIVLAGAATVAVPLEPGMKVHVSVAGLGDLNVDVSK